MSAPHKYQQDNQQINIMNWNAFWGKIFILFSLESLLLEIILEDVSKQNDSVVDGFAIQNLQIVYFKA